MKLSGLTFCICVILLFHTAEFERRSF